MNKRSFASFSKITVLALALSVVAFVAGCSKNANTTNGTNSTTTGNKTATTSTTSSATSTSSSGLSPKETIKAYYEAAARKDIAAAKSYLSQGTISLMETGAKNQGKTLDEALLEDTQTSRATPEMGAETITGDTATVEIKGPAGEQVKMPLVKEGGQWKLALDKLIGDMMRDMDQAPGPSRGGATPGSDDEDEHGSGNH